MSNLKEAIALYYEDDDKRDELGLLQNVDIFFTRLEMTV